MGLKMSQKTILSLAAQSQHKPKSSGFTLVELSIVLVIIGLIVGGVVGGKSLIRSAQVSSIAVDIQKVRTAVNAYKLQYDWIPGDHPEAEEYFGGLGCADSGSNPCSGDGDGWLNDPGGLRGSPTSNDEGFRAWQHLTLAKVYPGSYEGHTTIGVLLDITVPSIRIADAGLWFRGYEEIFGSGNNFLRIGGRMPTDGRWPWSGFLKPGEAKNLDKKLDDGVANTGILKAFDGTSEPFNSCTGHSWDDSGGDYILSRTTESCAIAVDVGMDN
jgi:prepilin-type N-terminal cleavage/methylation domain-containing protein